MTIDFCVLTFISALSKIQTSLVVSEIQSLKKEERDREQRSGKSLHPYQHTHIPQPEKYFAKARGLSWKNSNVVWRFTSRMTEVFVSPDEADTGQSSKRKSSTTRRLRKQLVYEARLQLPMWLVPRAWDLHVRKSYSGWNICLKPWTIRPYDSESFLYCLEGSTEDLRRALASNQASIYDRDPRGWTLLHVGYQSLTSGFKRLIVLSMHHGEDMSICSRSY